MNVKQLITRLLEYESDADIYVLIGEFQSNGTAEGFEKLQAIDVDTSGRILFSCDYELRRAL